MTSSSEQFRELDTLLEKWCENRLSAEDLARLERLVLSDSRAMQRYLGYVQLHGTLSWDMAVSGEPAARSPGLVDGEFPGIHSHDPRPSRPRFGTRSRGTPARWITLAACAAVLAAVAARLWVAAALEPNEEPLAKQLHKDDPVRSLHLLADEAQPVPRTILPIELEPHRRDTEQVPNPDAESIADVPLAPDTDPDTDTASFIDRQLAAVWGAADVLPSPDAKDGAWLRRASLDLAGRIPSLEALTRFIEDDDPHKRADFVERVLAGDQFAQHFSTVWANQLVGRSSDTARERHGLQQFLAAQFGGNRPWNETIAELIAAEGSVQDNGAAGFLLANLNNAAVPATAVTARSFLGQQVQCTQCHKHPWNDWSQEQFWKLNAFFQQARLTRRDNVPVLVDDAVGGPTFYESRRGVMQATYPEYTGVPVDPSEGTVRRRELANLMSKDTQLARAFVNRTWAHFFGYGFTNPVDDMGPHNPPSHPELLERLAGDFRDNGYDVQKLVRWITGSRAYQLSSRVGESNPADDPAAGNAPLFSRMSAKPFTPEQVFDSLNVAAAGDAYAGHALIDRRNERETWVQQFFDVLDNEENGELTTFGGSVTQALTMINGPLMNAALSSEPGTLLHRILSERMTDEDRIQQLCRAALSRDPTEAEWLQFRRQLGHAKSGRSRDRRAQVNEILRDIYWAYLNSSEFLTNR